ncbi:MAG: chemotaxis protein CheW [Methanoregulaceae archaeon]|nr:chemotaxis protein CheW [Methanoregulaceae archaeon]
MNGTRDVIEFSIGKEVYAVDLADVREVIGHDSRTVYSGARLVGAFARAVKTYPVGLHHISQYRGEDMVILDPSGVLNIPEGGPGERKRVVIVLRESATRILTGLIVDEIRTVTTISGDMVEDPSSILDNRNQLVKGIIRGSSSKGSGDPEFVIWLDLRVLIGLMEKGGA